MFRTVSEIRAGNGRSFIAENASAPVPEAFARSERRGEAVGGSRKHFPIFWAIMPTCSRSIAGGANPLPFFGAAWEKKTGDTRARLLIRSTKHRPKGLNKGTHLVGGPAPRGLPSPGAACAGGAPNRPRPRARAVRPARGNPWGRSGRLHAPEAARTGPVNALRRYSSWSPPGRWLNGHNGHFSCQPGRDHLGTSPGGYGSGFNGPRAVLKILPNKIQGN